MFVMKLISAMMRSKEALNASFFVITSNENCFHLEIVLLLVKKYAIMEEVMNNDRNNT